MKNKNFFKLIALKTKFILKALDRREDMILSAIAKSRDTQYTKKIDHENAWK